MQILKKIRPLMTLTLLLVSMSAVAQSAFEHDYNHNHHESKAHVHGQAELNLNVQGHLLDIELSIPAMDALGFEHQPRTETEREKLEAIVSLLNKVNSWIVPADEALCRLKSNALLRPYEKAPNDSEKKSQDDHDHFSAHSDFTITSQWYCTKASDLRRVHLDLFKHLSNLQTINVNWIKNGAAGISTLTVKSSELSFE